jgi:hypothetical protein
MSAAACSAILSMPFGMVAAADISTKTTTTITG